MNAKKTAAAMTTTNDTPSAALARAEPSALAARDELADLALEDGEALDDGLGEIDREDIRIAALVYNFKGVDKNGRSIPADAFYNTIDETVAQEVNAAFLLLKKTNLYSIYIEAEKKTDIICRSHDRIKGEMKDGTIRPCAGCPDAEWKTTAAGKRGRNCSPVWNLIGIDRDAGQPFMIRFKRTSLGVIKQHLQKYHIGRRVLRGGQHANYPLYSFGVRLTCKMADAKATYAVPVIEKVGVLPADEIRAYAQAMKSLQAQTQAVIVQTEDTIEHREGGDATDFSYGANAPDSSSDKYAGDVGEDFTPAKGA